MLGTFNKALGHKLTNSSVPYAKSLPFENVAREGKPTAVKTKFKISGNFAGISVIWEYFIIFFNLFENKKKSFLSKNILVKNGYSRCRRRRRCR